MTMAEEPGPVTPPKPLELVLAQRANDAMAGGKDPTSVTQNLHLMLQHLRANPDAAASAQDALNRGVDPAKIEARTWELAQGDAAKNPTGYSGQPAKAGMIQNAFDMLPFATKGMAGMDAVGDAVDAKLHGGSFVPTLRAAYNQNYGAREAALGKFRNDSPGQALASGAVGVLGPIVATMGAAAPEEAAALGLPKLSLATRMLRGARTGMGLGALQGASQAHGGVSDYATSIGENAAFGTVAGAAGPLVGSAAGAGARALGIPNAVSRGAGFLADASPFGNRFFSRLSASTGTRGEAAEEIGRRLAMDQGSPPNVPAASGLPPLALDAGGPNMLSLAENIAKRPGQGQTFLRNAVATRQAGMRDAVNKALDQGTGTTAASGAGLLQNLADEQNNIANVTRIGEESAFPKSPTAAPLQAWADINGGNLENGVAAHEALVKQKNAVAQRVFTAAKEATKGQGVESPTFEAIRKTPAGQIADGFAADQMANRQRTLPTAESPPAGMSAEQFADKNALAAKRGMAPIPGQSRELPDPEYIHYFKQRLAQLARLGVHDGSQGTISTQAQGVLGLFQQVRNELPPIWRAADDATAAQFRLIDANNMGRDLMRTQLNPSGNKALRTSMDAVEGRFGEMPPEEQQPARVGMQSAITDHLRSGNVSPKGLAAQLQEPTSAMARRVALATGDNTAPQRLAQSLGLQYQGPAAPPIPAPSAEGKAAGLGLDVLKHGVSAPSNAPSRSLTVLNRSRAAMAPNEQSALREGSAQALRGEFAGTTVASPGRVFGANNPERAAQAAIAFPTPSAYEQFRGSVTGWDAAQAQANRLTTGSPTFPLAAEESARESGKALGLGSELIRGNVGNVVKGVLGDAASSANSAARQQLDAEIARLLAKPNRTELEDAQVNALLRRRVQGSASRLLPRLTASTATNPESPLENQR